MVVVLPLELPRRALCDEQSPSPKREAEVHLPDEIAESGHACHSSCYKSMKGVVGEREERRGRGFNLRGGPNEFTSKPTPRSR